LDVFKDLTSVDDVTARLLFDNDIKSVDDLRMLSLKELIQIDGIDKKDAKKIKKELEKSVKKSDGKEVEGEVSTDLSDIALDVFKDLTSVDDVTARLLFDNDIKSVDDLRMLSLKELIQIDGIKKKVAKKIKKEFDEKFN
jgi:ERCC4-type nuclease